MKVPKIPPKQPYNLHPRGPHIKNLEAKALKATNGQCVIIMRKSDKAKFTVNMLVWKRMKYFRFVKGLFYRMSYWSSQRFG